MMILENTSHSFTCRRTKKEAFENNDVIHHLLQLNATHPGSDEDF